MYAEGVLPPQLKKFLSYLLAGKSTPHTDTKHRDTRQTEIHRSEKWVCKAEDAVKCFINPFDLGTKDKLMILSSGSAASEDVTRDVLRADKAGKEARDVFVTKQLESGKDFFQPVKRLKLNTLEDMNKKVKVTTSKNKIVQYKQQGNIAFQLFVKSQIQDIQLDLKELMKYPLTPVPYSISTADGFLVKTDKSKSFHHITKDVDDAIASPPNETLVIHDGNASFYDMKEIPGNFRHICRKIFDMMSKGNVVFSTDSYKDKSIKSMERKRRGDTEKLIVRGEAMKKPPDWKSFLANDENKKQFVKLLYNEWSKNEYVTDLHGREVILICDGSAHLLTSDDGCSTTKTQPSTQEETDTRIIPYCKYAQRKGYAYIRVKSPDTDVFFILLHNAGSFPDITILFDTGTGNKKRLLNISELARALTPEYCTALLCLHGFTSCDTISAFKGLGKLKPLKAMRKTQKYAVELSKLGDNWTVSKELEDQLDSFTCAIYGQSRAKDVDTVRHLKINELCSKDD